MQDAYLHICIFAHQHIQSPFSFIYSHITKKNVNKKMIKIC